MPKMNGGKFMDSPKGMFSYKDNPMKAPRQVKPEIGPGSNSDAKKANMLLQKAQKQQDSLRGKSGM